MIRYIQPAAPVYHVQPPPAHVARRRVNIRSDHVRLHTVPGEPLKIRRTMDGIHEAKQRVRAVAVPQHRVRQDGPQSGVGVLPAIFADAWHITADVPWIRLGMVERRREQQDQLLLTIHQLLI